MNIIYYFRQNVYNINIIYAVTKRTNLNLFFKKNSICLEKCDIKYRELNQ